MITSNQIEAARIAMTRYQARRRFDKDIPDKPVTQKPADHRVPVKVT